MAERRGILERVGPGLITAAVVIGPGSIVASSQAGAEAGYRLVWLLLTACLFMAVFTAMGARLGCALTVTPLQYLAQRWGRGTAVVVGLSAFLVTAGFQFGNNLGVSAGMSGLMPVPPWIWPPLFTVLALVFLLSARNLYDLIEKVMMALVATMLLAFVTNLFWTGISPTGLASGLVPRPFAESEFIVAGAMLATTFSAVAAFYQAYLVRAKGWQATDVRTAIGDTWIGIACLGSIALVILIGAAEALHGKEAGFRTVGRLAEQLSGALGSRGAHLVFCLGLGAASFSSFLANALIGGTLMADGLGQKAEVGSRATKAWTAVVMLVGCGVALLFMLAEKGVTQSLLIAQAATLVAAPVCAVLLYALSSSRRLMGALRNRWPSLVLGAVGLLLMASLFVRGAKQLLDKLAALFT